MCVLADTIRTQHPVQSSETRSCCVCAAVTQQWHHYHGNGRQKYVLSVARWKKPLVIMMAGLCMNDDNLINEHLDAGGVGSGSSRCSVRAPWRILLSTRDASIWGLRQQYCRFANDTKHLHILGSPGINTQNCKYSLGQCEEIANTSISKNRFKVIECFLLFCAHWFRPVDDSLAVEEHERRRDLSRVETSSGLLELPGLLNVEHQIASIHKFHHKEEAVLRWGGEEMTIAWVQLKLPIQWWRSNPTPTLPQCFAKVRKRERAETPPRMKRRGRS